MNSVRSKGGSRTKSGRLYRLKVHFSRRKTVVKLIKAYMKTFSDKVT